MSNEALIREHLEIARQLAAAEKLSLLVYLIDMALLENVCEAEEAQIVLTSSPDRAFGLLHKN